MYNLFYIAYLLMMLWLVSVSFLWHSVLVNIQWSKNAWRLYQTSVAASGWLTGRWHWCILSPLTCLRHHFLTIKGKKLPLFEKWRHHFQISFLWNGSTSQRGAKIVPLRTRKWCLRGAILVPLFFLSFRRADMYPSILFGDNRKFETKHSLVKI